MKRFRIDSARLGYVLAVALPLLVCAVLIPFRTELHIANAALIFALIVWVCAALGGVWPGLLAAFLSFVAMFYALVPPYYEFSVREPSDWFSLGVFVLVAGIQGLQTGRMRDREARAIRGEREAQALVALAGELISHSSTAVVGRTLTHEVAQATGSSLVAALAPDETGSLVRLAASDDRGFVIDAGIQRFAEWVMNNGVAVGIPLAAPVSDDRTGAINWLDSVQHEAVVEGAKRNDVFLPLAGPAGTEGVLYLAPRPGRRPLDVRGIRVAVSFARILGAFLERERLQAVASQAESARELDELKSTLISSVSHELKTPLAAMTATVSGLLADDADLDAAYVRSGLEAVDEDLRRLSASISDLLDISRLESDSWQARREPYEVSEIVGSLVGRLDASTRSRVSVEIPDDLPPIEVDFVQWSRALSNILENALAYAGPDAHVRVGAAVTDGHVETWIEDDGPGIATEERVKVFDKFYRGGASERMPSGTGLGLTIAREIVLFNDGTIDVESAWPHGARFVVSVPAAQPFVLADPNPNPLGAEG